MRFSRFHAIASMLLACCPALVSCGSDSAAGGPVLFQGTFRNVHGTDDSPVTDLRTTTRGCGCGYSSRDARIDHGNSYDIVEVAFTIETSLDDKTGTLWQAELQASRPTVANTPRCQEPTTSFRSAPAGTSLARARSSSSSATSTRTDQHRSQEHPGSRSQTPPVTTLGCA
jgi:hypothetical protein